MGKKYQFNFQRKEIEIVNLYICLELTLVPWGNKHKDIKNLLNKALKA